jgi:cytochrome c oxidase subunit 4
MTAESASVPHEEVARHHRSPGHGDHGPGGHEIDVDKHVKTYIIVFVSLLVLTLVTVGISYLHLSTLPAIVLALLVATVKGSLVACYFMHLISERKLIYAVLGLTVLFFFFCLLGPWLTEGGQVGSHLHPAGPAAAEAPPAH